MKNISILFLTALLVFSGCSKDEAYKKIDLPEGTHRIVVKKHMKAAGYTYILANDNGKEQWLAILEMPIEDGDTFYYSDAMEMKNFKSKTLNKTFESIMFVNNISKKLRTATSKQPDEEIIHEKPKVEKVNNVKVKPLRDGETISSLYKNKAKLKGKTVKLRGIVVKYNPDILNKNWIHIQDGTSYNDNNDILITTKDQVKVGDTIIVEGVLELDKDFGAGYFYDVLIEKAKIKIESKI